MNYFIIIFITILSLLVVLMCYQESKKRKINFFVALLICILVTPLFGYFIITNFKLRNPLGCNWCGNKYNEVEYCGVCNKNIAGEIRPEYNSK